MTESITSKRHVKARQREEAAMRLRLSGTTYKDIGDELGISMQAAYKAVKRVMDRTTQHANEDGDELRRLEVARLDKMLAAMWPNVLAGSYGAVDRCLKTSERRARLLGLDAPTRQDVTSGGEKIKGYAIISPDDWDAKPDETG